MASVLYSKLGINHPSRYHASQARSGIPLHYSEMNRQAAVHIDTYMSHDTIQEADTLKHPIQLPAIQLPTIQLPAHPVAGPSHAISTSTARSKAKGKAKPDHQPSRDTLAARFARQNDQMARRESKDTQHANDGKN